ncbi:MAG: beta-ketoacyl-ACP synthase III [Longimicrobiales bacterium]
MKNGTPVAAITATARFLPERVLTNAELEEMVDTDDKWIRERTGIRERRIAPDDMTAADMGGRAAMCALKKAGLEPTDVDLLIVSTATPDRWLPSTACDVQARIGATNCHAYDLSAACTGFLYALTLAEGYIAAGRAETILIVSTEKMSSIVNWEDRATCILFGDGAGAAVVRPSEDGRGIISSHHRSDGNLAPLLHRPAGGSAMPLDAAALDAGAHLVHMEGREIFKNAVRSMAKSGVKVLEEGGFEASDVDLMVPHQANVRIIESTAKYARIPMEKVFVNLDRYGNISSATIPVALDEADEQGLIQPGSLVLMTAFGAGLTWGAVTLSW